MELNELEDILQSKVPTEISFLSEIGNDVKNEDNEKKEKELEPIKTKQYTCSKCGEIFNSLPELMLHSRREHPKAKKEKNIDIDIDNEVTNDMKDENNSLEIISDDSDIVETETKKPKGKSSPKVDVTKMPTLYDALEDLLKGYGVRGYKGIMQTAALHDIGKPEFIPILKDIIRGTATPGLIAPITDAWALRIGTKPETELVKLHNLNPVTGQVNINEVDTVLRQMELDEARSLAMGSRRSMIEERELNNEMKRKRLSGELNDPKTSELDRLKIELELMKMQNSQPHSNELNDIKLELMKMQMQQNNKPNGIDELKSELAKLQLQLSAPKTDGQVELLKQQIEAQNRKYEEIQRKTDEESKLRLLSEQHKQEMDILKQQIAEQSKQTQEIMKAIQTSSTPKTEDIFKQQMAEVQRLNDTKFQTVLDQLKAVTESKREDEYRRTIETLKEQIKDNRDQSMGAVGQVADSMKSFATDITHVIEKRDLKDEYNKKEEELKKKINEIEHNKSLTNEQYVMEKTGKIAEEAIKALGSGIDGFGKALQPATKSAAESSAIMERAALAMDLKSKGFDTQTINNILSTQSKSTLPSAKSEYENLQRMTTQMTDERNAMHSSIEDISIPQEQTVSEQTPEQTTVKFATGENE